MFEERKKSKLGIGGVILTVVYFTAVTIFVVRTNSFEDLRNLELNELGDFLAGVFGPPALIWVVISFYLQSDELRHSVDALNLQAEELKNSVTQQKEMVNVTKQQLELDIIVRKEETAALLSKELPLIVVEGRGNSPSSETKGRLFKFVLKNIGAPAKSIAYSLDTKLVTLNSSSFGYLAHDQEIPIGVRTNNTTSLPENGCTLTVTSTNIDGKSRVQYYLIGNFQPEEVKHKITYE